MQSLLRGAPVSCPVYLHVAGVEVLPHIAGDDVAKPVQVLLQRVETDVPVTPRNVFVDPEETIS